MPLPKDHFSFLTSMRLMNIFPPGPGSRVKAILGGLVERLLLINRAALVPGDLDDHEIIAAVDAEIIRVE
jgi:hypothetical protein